ncbi:MAG: hypothetical protein ACE5FM_10020 [Methyloligellaceae bacterium]
MKLSTGTRWDRTILLFGLPLPLAGSRASAAMLDDVLARGFIEGGLQYAPPLR